MQNLLIRANGYRKLPRVDGQVFEKFAGVVVTMRIDDLVR
jgi:hypothetical protein